MARARHTDLCFLIEKPCSYEYARIAWVTQRQISRARMVGAGTALLMVSRARTRGCPRPWKNPAAPENHPRRGRVGAHARRVARQSATDRGPAADCSHARDGVPPVHSDSHVAQRFASIGIKASDMNRSKPIAPSNVLRRWVWPACQAAHLERATWLTFRRRYSSWAHDKGVAGKVVAQIMGHAKVDPTMNVYTQVLDGSARSAADRVGSELVRSLRGRRRQFIDAFDDHNPSSTRRRSRTSVTMSDGAWASKTA
jgi:hypothetical protein